MLTAIPNALAVVMMPITGASLDKSRERRRHIVVSFRVYGLRPDHTFGICMLAGCLLVLAMPKRYWRCRSVSSIVEAV
jgi:hypothetical protein